MKNLSRLWVILMVFSIMFSAPAFAQSAAPGAIAEPDDSTWNPGITPDSPLYFIDGLGETIQLAITLDPEAKIDLELEFAEEKVAEAREMAKEGNFEAMAAAESQHDKVLDRLEVKIETIDTEGQNSQEKLETQLKIERKLKKHSEKVEDFETELREEIIVELVAGGEVTAEDQSIIVGTLKQLENRAEMIEETMDLEMVETKEQFENETGLDGEAIEEHLKHELGIKQEELEDAMEGMREAQEDMMAAMGSEDGMGAMGEASDFLMQAMVAFEEGDFDSAEDFANMAENHIHDETFWKADEGMQDPSGDSHWEIMASGENGADWRFPPVDGGQFAPGEGPYPDDGFAPGEGPYPGDGFAPGEGPYPDDGGQIAAGGPFPPVDGGGAMPWFMDMNSWFDEKESMNYEEMYVPPPMEDWYSEEMHLEEGQFGPEDGPHPDDEGPYPGGPNEGPYPGGPNEGPYPGGPNEGPHSGDGGPPGWYDGGDNQGQDPGAQTDYWNDGSSATYDEGGNYAGECNPQEEQCGDDGGDHGGAGGDQSYWNDGSSATYDEGGNYAGECNPQEEQCGDQAPAHGGGGGAGAGDMMGGGAGDMMGGGSGGDMMGGGYNPAPAPSAAGDMMGGSGPAPLSAPSESPPPSSAPAPPSSSDHGGDDDENDGGDGGGNHGGDRGGH